MWSRRRELNSRPLPYQGSALPLSYAGKNLRAEDEVRTRDPQLGRLMLYRLSYFRNCISMNVGTDLLSLFSLTGGSQIRCGVVPRDGESDSLRCCPWKRALFQED